MVEIEVLGAPDEQPLARAARAALTAAGVEEGHLAIELVDRDRIRDLNRRYRGHDEPTDVLSFPVDQGPPELGDVIICLEYTGDVREAVVHGVLHLCGHDHETDAGEMLELQRRILASL